MASSHPLFGAGWTWEAGEGLSTLGSHRERRKDGLGRKDNVWASFLLQLVGAQRQDCRYQDLFLFRTTHQKHLSPDKFWVLQKSRLQEFSSEFQNTGLLKDIIWNSSCGMDIKTNVTFFWPFVRKLDSDCRLKKRQGTEVVHTGPGVFLGWGHLSYCGGCWDAGHCRNALWSKVKKMVEQEVGSSFWLESSEFFMKEFPFEKRFECRQWFLFLFLRGSGFCKAQVRFLAMRGWKKIAGEKIKESKRFFSPFYSKWWE